MGSRQRYYQSPLSPEYSLPPQTVYPPPPRATSPLPQTEFYTPAKWKEWVEFTLELQQTDRTGLVSGGHVTCPGTIHAHNMRTGQGRLELWLWEISRKVLGSMMGVYSEIDSRRRRGGIQ